MVLLNEGLNKIKDLMNDNVDECDWGTGTTAATVTDTGLETEISGVEVTTTNSTADKTVQLTGVLVSTAGNSNTVSENVFRFSDGTDLLRNTFTGVSKTANKELHNIQTITLTRG